MSTIRTSLTAATASFLGETLGFEPEQWQEPSLLPGWTRAHVATHVARNADAMRRIIEGTLAGRPVDLYESEARRYSDIQRGAEREPLQIQIDLDTSADLFERTLDQVRDWDMVVRLPTRETSLMRVVLDRFQEVTLHHLDLRGRFSTEDVYPVPARWLLQQAIGRLQGRDLPAVHIRSDSGVEADIGNLGTRVTVRGKDARLWAWVMGRKSDSSIPGSQGITFPVAP